MFVFLLNNVPVRGIIVPFALFNRIAPCLVLILESPRAYFGGASRLFPPHLSVLYGAISSHPRLPPPSSSRLPSSSPVLFPPFFFRARIIYIMYRRQKYIFFRKKSRNVLPVSGKGVPLHPQMRADRLSGGGQSLMRSIGSTLFERFT